MEDKDKTRNNRLAAYIAGLLVSAALIVLCLTVLGHTKIIGGLLIGPSIVLFFFSLIQLCRTHEKIKNAVKAIIELLLG
ncbi:MAG: hypothetical protein IJR95_07105 [Lachnospiraceae bacterium]|nr:hypothetical protein [Lachnospiraceae bacterium]